MNIAHIYPAVLRMHGATKWLMLFASAMQRCGNESTIYCPIFCVEVPTWFQGKIITFHKSARHYELEGLLKLLSIVIQLASVFLIPIKISRNTDTVVLHSELSLFALPLCRIFLPGRKVIYYCYQPPRELYDLKSTAKRQYGVWYSILGPAFWIYKKIDYLLVRNVDKVLVWCEQAKEYAREIYGDIEFHCVPAGVDYKMFEKSRIDSNRLENLRRYINGEGKSVLLMNSALIAKKRIPLFIHLVERLKKEGIKVVGIVIGEGPESRNLQTMIADLDLEINFMLLGFVTQEDLVAYCNLADIFYYFEVDGIWTMSTIEAGAVGKPVIVAAGGSMSTLVEDGHTGYVISDKNFEDELFEKTVYLLSNRMILEKMGRNNFIYSQLFSADSSVKKFIELIA